jgi:tripartite-type tricarboxylate transporter receptor subunit TctC
MEKMSKRLRWHGAVALALAVWMAGVPVELLAQAYPVKPIRVMVGAAAGSNTDFFFRVVAPSMSATLGQQLVADYRPGAGGLVGAATAAKSPPDGYVISMLSSGFVIQPAMVANMPYDALRDFSPLGLIVDVPQALVTHPALPARTLKELIALARARPGQLNSGSSGMGTNNHLAGVLFNQLAKVNIVLVPYRSSPPMMVDLISGQIQITFPSIPAIIRLVRDGRLRMVAQTGRARSATALDVPTMREAGMPEFSLNSGFGFAGPAQLPRPVVERLNAALVKAVQDPANRKLLIENGADPVGSTPQEHEAFNRSEVARWTKLVKAAGIQPE